MPSCVIPRKSHPWPWHWRPCWLARPHRRRHPTQHGSAAQRSGDSAARLTCFDQWAGQQAWQAPAASAAQEVPPAAPSLVDTTLPATRMIEVAQTAGCRDPQYSSLALLGAGDGQRLRHLQLAATGPSPPRVVTASSVNRQPTSSAPDHSASQSIPYRRTEARLQPPCAPRSPRACSPRTIPHASDSLWFGYTQQSYLAGVLAPDLAPFPHDRP